MSGGGDNPPMNSESILPAGFVVNHDGLGASTGGDESIGVAAALAEIDARQSNGNEDTFYDELTGPGVVIDGGIGSYHLVARTTEGENINRVVPHAGDSPFVRLGTDMSRFSRAVESFAIYSHLAVGWGSYTGGNGMDFVGGGLIAIEPSPSLPTRGEATYALEGRGWLTHWESNNYRSPNEIYEIVMSGELVANFGEDSVTGYLESDYGYKIAEQAMPSPERRITHIPEGITAAKYFGNDRENTPSELGVSAVRLGISDDSNRPSFISARDIWDHRGVSISYGDPSCGVRQCFVGDIDVPHNMATGVFDRLTTGNDVQRYMGNDLVELAGNQVGFTYGRFAGPNQEQVVGHFFAQNVFAENSVGRSGTKIADGEPHLISRLHGTFAGTKQSESE